MHDFKRRRAGVFFNAVDVSFLRRVVCTVITLSELHFFFSAGGDLELTLTLKETLRKNIWRTYSAGKTAALLHGIYAALNVFIYVLIMLLRC